MVEKEVKEAIGVGILVLGIMIWAIYDYLKYYNVSKSKYYTIAEIYNISPSDAGWFIDYTFIFNEQKYEGTNSMPTKAGGDWVYNPHVGERYYVKFLKDAPYYAIICLDRQVPDSIKEAPKEGWVGDLPCADNYE